eukprot:TRINITY_DN12081_c0_g1_i2.p1 TRINITY_DN12081_c0_g1~~TRINITY_DN12081_c0_g1_i2.p1  ORF type:complete len:562 (+),score=115.40 TRINITY_DN12081_c0_g1_i2:60-1745(+)
MRRRVAPAAAAASAATLVAAWRLSDGRCFFLAPSAAAPTNTPVRHLADGGQSGSALSLPGSASAGFLQGASAAHQGSRSAVAPWRRVLRKTRRRGKEGDSGNKGRNPFRRFQPNVKEFLASLHPRQLRQAPQKALPLLFLAALVLRIVAYYRRARQVQELTLSAFLDFVNTPTVAIKQAVVGATQCTLVLEGGRRLCTRWPTSMRPAVEDLWSTLRGAHISIVAEKVSTSPYMAFSMLCMMAYLFMLYNMTQRMSSGGSSRRGGWKDARKQVLEQAQGEAGGGGLVSRFSDIAGIDGAKLQVMEVVNMLNNPSPYSVLGARVPRGLLLTGPPGSGKTLLARACAAEAGLPFISASASEFMELFVGRGAARVRSLFERAEKLAPCLVFIDEIDSLKTRGNGGLGLGSAGSQEAEQTLNQLLASMDGLTGRGGTAKPIVVVAATNRPQVLDEALLRPGRFDRVVEVGLPDTLGRLQIINVHCRIKQVPLAQDVVRNQFLPKLADKCEGLAGAALEALVNEAAIRAARRQATEVCAADFEEALDHYKSSRKAATATGPFPAWMQ